MFNFAGPLKALPRSLLAIGAAFALLIVAPAITSVARADDMQDATQMLRAGQHQQALERINRVLAAKPRDAQARFLKGLILTEQGNTKEAIVIFQKLTEDYPDLPEPYNNLAVIYAAQGEYEKARASLIQSIRTHPSYATAYENLGDVYAKLASQAYDKALQLDSSNSAAQNKLALVHELVGGAPRGTAAGVKPPPSKPVAIAAAPMEAKPVAPAPDVKAPAPPAPGAAAPTPAPERTAEKSAAKPAAGSSAEVVNMLNAWAHAWSKKDVDTYLAFYAKDFKTPNGEPRGEWEQGRRVRIQGPKSITVSADGPKVSIAGANQASVTFRQRYKSDTLTANSTKTLVLVKTDGRWQIQQEQVAN